MICVVFLICTASPVSDVLADSMNDVVKSSSNVASKAFDTNYKCYSKLELAVEDANNLTTKNSDTDRLQAEAGLEIKNGKAYIILYRNTNDTETLNLTNDTNISLNNKTLNMKNGCNINTNDNLQLYNGVVNISESNRGIYPQNIDSQTNITNVKYNFSATSTPKGTYALVGTSSIKINKCDINMQIENSTKSTAIILVRSNINLDISNSTINQVVHGTPSTFGIAITSDSNINLTNNNMYIKSNTGSTIGIYTQSKTNITINGGSYRNNNGAALYSGNKDSNITIHGGKFSTNYYNTTSPGIVNDGTLTIDENKGSVYVCGRNSAVQLNEGSKNYINGGTFESPQHGGIYCCSGSTGHTEINGGTFKNIGGSVNGWNTAYSFGAAYFGGANNTKAAWHVDVKNAKFINEWGDHGIVQKSNSGYIPPTINLYNTYISGKGDDINIQNNDSVKLYNAYVNLYAGTVLEHNKIRDYYADGHNGESFVKDYR